MISSTSISSSLRFVLGLAVAFIGMELGLRLLPVVHFPRVIEPTFEFRHNPPGRNFRLSTGWRMEDVQTGHFNNYGFRSKADFIPNSGSIALIGNSFVEGITGHYTITLAEHLSAKLPVGKNTVFALGYSGNTLADHLRNIELASGELSAKTIVVLITSIDIATSWQEPEQWGHYYDLSSGRAQIRFKRLDLGWLRATLERLASASALFSYVRYNLQPHGHYTRWAASLSTVAEDTPLARRNNVAVVDQFVATLEQIPGLDPANLIFVFDADRESLNAGLEPKMAAAEDYLMRTLNGVGVRTLDLTPYFERHDIESDGPYDYLPADFHWNATGKEIATTAIAEALGRSNTPLDRKP